MRNFFCFFFICFSLFACSRKQEMYGYVDAKYTYLSSIYTGTMIELNVEKGNAVKKGDNLFSLDTTPESLSVQGGSAQIDSANRNLEAKKIAAIQAENNLKIIKSQEEQAKSNIEFWTKQYERSKNLLSKKVTSQADFDSTKNNYVQAQKAYEVAKENINQAKLTFDQSKENIKSAQSDVENLQSILKKNNWDKLQKVIASPSDGFIFDTYYNVGEVVPAGKPVLSLLAPKDIYILFFVKEPYLSKLKVGQKIEISCDNCANKLTGHISFISPQAEYTSPLIYSDSEKDQLMFRAEAIFDFLKSKELKPGLPVQVSVL